MNESSLPLVSRLADIGGQLQKLRWEAVDAGHVDMARDIAHAIEAIAWAAGIYTQGANVVERPGDQLNERHTAANSGTAPAARKINRE